MTEEKNAVIKSTSLGYEDHGIMTFFLHLDYGGGGQGFGGYGLDKPNDGDRPPYRLGTAFGLEAIMRVLDVVGVSEWEKLPGKSVRVRACHDKVKELGHYLKEEWLNMEELAQQHRDVTQK